MSNDFLPFSRPSISQAAIDEMVETLKSGALATGASVAKLTLDLQDYFQAPFVVPLASGTAGLHLALLAMEVGPGDEVITSPLTFAATLNTIVLTGAKPILVDIDPDTFNMDLNQLEDAMSEHTSVILPAHFAGLPIELETMYAMGDRYGVRVLEDASHAIGAEYQEKRIGSMGDTQIFSFHPHNIMTTGEGGCVVTRDQGLAEQVARLSNHGMERQLWNSIRSYHQEDEIVLPGYQCNMLDMHAVIGIHQLQSLNDFINRRNELANRYNEALSDWMQWTLPKQPTYNHLHAWQFYTPLINEDATALNRDEFMRAMKERNIGTGLHYRAAHLQPYYREVFGFKFGDFPNAEEVCERIVSLPLFPAMTDAEQDHVIDVMYNVFNN